ncbi:dual specificity protein phosphatase 14-like [Clavelina lepadiformis]|uniref:dual specificity protein phosphatase 14-like n=1 Tax=Clavelina lepadiformis TaxID=159417 RepID=UPI0040419B1C
MWNTIHEITPNLYLCSGTAVTNKEAVLSRNISLIINATLDLPNRSWNTRIDVVRIPVNDVPHAHLEPYFDKVADLINDRAKLGQKCLVHCVAGVSRSASLCIAYLIKYCRMSLREAHNHVRSRRSIIRPNVGFWRQLIEFEKKTRGAKSVSMVQSSIGLVPDVYYNETRSMISWLGRARR